MLNEKYLSNSKIKSLVQKYPVAKEERIKENLLSEVKEWSGGVRRWLQKENPFYDDQHEFKNANRSLKKKKFSIEKIEDDFLKFQSLSKKTMTNIDDKFWIFEINELKNKFKLGLLADKFGNNEETLNKDTCNENQLIFRTLLQGQWQKLLDTKYLEWELGAIDKYRNDFLEKLSEWLHLIQKLDNTLSSLSLEPGLLLDLSQGSLSLSDIESLRKWVTYISKDDGVKNLCDIMGRLRQAGKAKRQELVKNIMTVQEFVPDVNSKEEIVGIHLGRDIEHTLPQELLLLADDEISILFDMKYTEDRLICFDMEGSQQKENPIEEEIVIETDDKEEFGPIIICVDTSGSMQGSPETVAKAVTLFMATRAIGQNRNCFLINFSTEIETIDLSRSVGISKVIEFLQRSFHGGTDASPALKHALELMKEKEYKKADLLMISDFIMASLPDELKSKINDAKENKNKFYSLSIGNIFLEERLITIFDNEWVYNPTNCSVHSLQTMISEI